VTVAVPGAMPVKVTEQLPANNVQLVGLKVPTKVFDDVNVTVPVGTIAVPKSVSVTMAVQVDA
jgi:hypothetical protein